MKLIESPGMTNLVLAQTNVLSDFHAFLRTCILLKEQKNYSYCYCCTLNLASLLHFVLNLNFVPFED